MKVLNSKAITNAAALLTMKRIKLNAAWNLNYRTNGGTLQTFTVDGKNQLTSDPVSATDTYDGNGNLTNRYNVMAGAYNYGYDDENELTSAEQATQWRTEFVYDGKGRMRKRLEYTWTGSAWTLSTAVNYVYDGMRVIQERSSSNVPQVSYTRGTDLSGSLEGAGGIGGLLGRSHAYQTGSGNFTNHNYYHADGNGNVTYLLNNAQSKVAEYRYDPFGNTISSSGSLSAANVYRFSSKEIHVNSGMYYYTHRFYDPNLQRWLNRDPIGRRGGKNLYAFVNNSPTGVFDPLGLIGIRKMGCDDPCGDAKKMGLDKEPDGSKVPGGTVCCGGKKYGCVWDKSTGGSGPITNPKAQDVIGKCIQEHEDTHVAQPNNCPNGCVISNVTDPDAKTHDKNECEAYQQSLRCLQDSRGDCGGDPVCLNQVNSEITFNDQKQSQHCH